MDAESARRAAKRPPAGPRGETNYVRVANRLREEIIGGILKPGEWLRMSAVAARCGVSVQPVREALPQLEGEGLIEIFPNRGARVRGIDRQRLIHAHQIGEALEGYLAKQFAEEASLSDIRKLEALQKAHDEALDGEDWPGIEAANDAFHRFINAHGGNMEAIAIIVRFYGLSHSLQDWYGRAPRYIERVRREHHDLLDAFLRRDPDAAAAIGSRHVRGTLEDILSVIDEADSKPSTG